MVLKKVLLTLSLSAVAFADTGFVSTIRVSEQDSAPACTVGQIKVTNGTLTCNGQVANITTGGGGGSGLTYLSNSSSNTISSSDIEFNSASIGPVLRDANSCLWRTTIGTAGNLITTLLACPTVVASRGCFPGQPVGLLAAIVCPRP